MGGRWPVVAPRWSRRWWAARWTPARPRTWADTRKRWGIALVGQRNIICWVKSRISKGCRRAIETVWPSKWYFNTMLFPFRSSGIQFHKLIIFIFILVDISRMFGNGISWWWDVDKRLLRWIGVHGSDHDDFGDVGDFVSFAFYIHADMSWYYRLSWKASISSLMIVGHNHILVVMMVLSHHWWWWWWLDRLVQGKPALSVLCPVQHHHHHHPRLRQLTNVEYYLFWLRQWKAVFLNLIFDWTSTLKSTDSLSSTDKRMLISLRSSTSSELCQIYANP